MANLNELGVALQNAHAAGDTQAATILATEITRQRAAGDDRQPVAQHDWSAFPVAQQASEWDAFPRASAQAGGKSLAEIRQQYPQYSDMSDTALADALHAKFYSDMPRSEFNAKIGLDRPNQALDIAKGIGVGGVKAIENAPATIPVLSGYAGQGAQYLLDKFAPGTTDPQQVANQAKMLELAQQARGGGVAGMLPQPQTPAGEAASYATQYALPAAGFSGSVARNVVGGAASGLGAYGAGQLAPEEYKPLAEAGGALLAGVGGLKTAGAAENFFARRAQPTAEQIGEHASAGYNALREDLKTPLAPNVMGSVANDAQEALAARGLGPGPKEATGVSKNLADLQAAQPELASVYDLRGSLKSHYQVPDLPEAKAQASVAGQNPAVIGLNKAGAYQAQPIVEALLEREAPGTMGKLNQLDRDFAISKAAGSLDRKLNQLEATASRTTVGEAMQKRVNAFLNSNDAKYLSDADKKLMKDAAKGSLTQRGLSLVATLTGSGGSGPLGKAVSAIMPVSGAYGTYATGDPTYAAVGIGGHGAKVGSNYLLANRAKVASALLRGQSSLGQQARMQVAPSISTPRAGAIAAALTARNDRNNNKRGR